MDAKALLDVEVTEEAAEVVHVGLAVEGEGAAVGEVFGELDGAALAELGDGDTLLFLHDHFVFFAGGFGLETLPGEDASEEVDEDVAD